MSINICLSPHTIILIHFFPVIFLPQTQKPTCHIHTHTFSLSVILLSLPPTQASVKEHVRFTAVAWSTLAETGRFRDLNVLNTLCALCCKSLMNVVFLNAGLKCQMLLANIFQRKFQHFYFHLSNLMRSRMPLVVKNVWDCKVQHYISQLHIHHFIFL